MDRRLAPHILDVGHLYQTNRRQIADGHRLRRLGKRNPSAGISHSGRSPQISRLNPRPLFDQAADKGVDDGASTFGVLSVGAGSETADGGVSSSSVKER